MTVGTTLCSNGRNGLERYLAAIRRGQVQVIQILPGEPIRFFVAHLNRVLLRLGRR